MDICLESFNPYNTDTDVINEGVNIFSKALEALSKIWHKILNTIKSIIDKFKKKSKNEPKTEGYDPKKDVKKYLIKHNVTTIESTIETGLGPMFKSFDDLIDYIELLGSGLDIVSKFYSTSVFSSETLSSLESEVSSYLADVAKSSKIELNPSNPSMWGVLVSKAMRDSDKDDDTEKNILEDHFGYNLTEIYNNEYHKFEDVAYDNASKADDLSKMVRNKSNMSSSNLDKRQRERLEKLQYAMKGIIDINTSAGVDLLIYIASINQVSVALTSAVLTIRRSEIDSLLKPKNESCFAYIR